ncbi:MAG: hypothetical protein E7Z89_07045 [Cyanobacteria bacterium SIG28]|nr:hypothetical protein [Cyanobacteria bacterium SIG28]
MISTKYCRQEFLEILKELCFKLDKNSRIKNQRKINLLKKYIEDEYNYDAELPIISHQLIIDMLKDLEKVDLLLSKILVSEAFDIPEDINEEKIQLATKVKYLIDKYDLSQKSFETTLKSVNIYPMLEKYVKIFGKERVIEALKSGLNIFLKQKSNIFSKKINLTDENWQKFLKYVQEKYPIETIEKYLNKGLISNFVFETKNSKNINTSELVDTALKLKKEGKYE